MGTIRQHQKKIFFSELDLGGSGLEEVPFPDLVPEIGMEEG